VRFGDPQMRRDGLAISHQPRINLSHSNYQAQTRRTFVDKLRHQARSTRGIAVKIALHNPWPETGGTDVAGKLDVKPPFSSHVVYRPNLDLMGDRQAFKDDTIEKPFAGDADPSLHNSIITGRAVTVVRLAVG
jgi:hypothetical protein